jgi:hypothetical protein
MKVLALTGYLAESATATDQDAPPWLLIVGGAIAALMYWSHQRDKEKNAVAQARFDAMSDDEIHDKERQILSSLKRGPCYVNELASAIDESSRTTLIIARLLYEADEVDVVVENAPESGPLAEGDHGAAQIPIVSPSLSTASRLRITPQGRMHLRERAPEVRVMSPNGDVNIATHGGTVNSKSIVVNSQNKFNEKYDAETVEALARIEAIVRSKGGPDDVKVLEGFLNEAKSENPNQPVLKSLFGALQQGVPTLASAADLAIKLQTLWS